MIKDQRLKHQIEEIVHRHVLTKINNQIRKINPQKKVVVEIPLLFESGFNDKCNEIIYVDVNDEVQIKHLEERCSPVNELRQINQNFNLANKKKATVVLDNNGTVANLKKQINSIFGK